MEDTRGSARRCSVPTMDDLNALPLTRLWSALVDQRRLRTLFELARDEDLGPEGDVTSATLIPEAATATAEVRSRGAGVVAGLLAVPELIDVFGGGVAWHPTLTDGNPCAAGEVIGVVSGRLRSILAIERPMLNLLGRLCGVATLTRTYVDAVAGTRAKVCETRKTTPGWRGLEKFAVRCGGGWLHRVGLFDAVLVKDNHLAWVGSIAALTARLERARQASDLRFVAVEADTLDQVREILSMPRGLVDIILLDNMNHAELGAAVGLRDATAPGVQIEASGGVSLETVRSIADTGVDRISVGALTHSAAALDVGLDMLLDQATDAAGSALP